MNSRFIFKDDQVTTIHIVDLQEIILTNRDKSSSLRVNFLLWWEMFNMVCDQLRTKISLSHDTQRVNSCPDSSSMISLGNCAVFHVDDLITVF